jgi:hypothetical protein
MTSWFSKMASSEQDSSRSIGHDAGPLGDVWREFSREDASCNAPPELERRVLAAWDALHQPARRHDRPSVPRLIWAAGAVACALLLALALQSHLATPAPSDPTPAGWPHPPSTAGAVMTLAVDPALETETLQLVRVRMPRRALAAVGLVVIGGGPDAEGLVEVDVVIGEDGLSRDVRRVALIQK